MYNDHETIDIFEIRRAASEMRAKHIASLVSSFKTWFKSHFTFGAVTHV